MPITVPELDGRDFEALLDEARRRIPVYTPEWTNFGVESDPGITIVQLFAFMTESLLYRANRIPERNRLKFLQLLNIPLQAAAPADGFITILNERGPVEPLLLDSGVTLSAGNVSFLTRDPLNVLPVQAYVCYKKRIPQSDPLYEQYRLKYEAVRLAKLVEQAEDLGQPLPTAADESAVELDFYETAQMPAPARGEPTPILNLLDGPTDRAVYLALLAPKNVSLDDVRRQIANQVLSIGVAPAPSGELPALRSTQPNARSAPAPGLVFEIADVTPGPPLARYARLRVLQQPDVLTAAGVVQVELPGYDRLLNWAFSEPLDEGSGDFPPRLEDDELRQRVVTWLRLRLPESSPDQGSLAAPSGPDYRLTWIGINAARVLQALPVFNEFLGLGNGEPDQSAALANLPVLPASLRLVVEGEAGQWRQWRMTDDLLAAGPDDEVFTLDPESGLVRFGDGLRGARPPVARRILASYEYGGGPQGNLGIGAINASKDVRLQGGFKIENPLPTTGGSLGETAADGERRIPLVLRHRERLVTLQDFRDIARRAPGVDVGRVEVLPLFLPSQPEAASPGVVTVMVVPRFDPLRPLWPEPDRLFLRRVCDHLEPRRLLTSEIYVRGPQYLSVYVSVGIQVRAGFFSDLVEQAVKERLNLYLSALPPGGPDGFGWPLNKRLLRKDLEAVVTRVPGVEFVESIEMGVVSPQDISERSLSGLELPRLAGLSVRQGAAESLESVFAPAGTSPEGAQLVPIPVSRAQC